MQGFIEILANYDHTVLKTTKGRILLCGSNVFLAMGFNKGVQGD